MADRNFLSFAHCRPLGEHWVGVLVPHPGTHDTLKITDSTEGTIHADRVEGGSEDCCDINNRCERIVVGDAHTLWEPKGRYAFTIKGGSAVITINGILRGHGKQADVALGDWSDQSRQRTGKVVINLMSEDGSPITWQRINAITPEFGVAQKFKRVWSVPGELRRLWVWLYALGKRMGLPI